MHCRSPIPLGGRVHPNLLSGRSFSRARSNLGRLERGALIGIWALAPHPRCLGHGGIQRAEGTGGSVGPESTRSGPATGNWRDPVLDRASAMAGFTGPRVLVCRSVGKYIRPVRWSGLRCPGENRMRRESGVPNVTYRPLVSWSMASAIGQGTSWFTGFVYAGWYSWTRLGTDETVGYG